MPAFGENSVENVGIFPTIHMETVRVRPSFPIHGEKIA